MWTPRRLSSVQAISCIYFCQYDEKMTSNEYWGMVDLKIDQVTSPRPATTTAPRKHYRDTAAIKLGGGVKLSCPFPVNTPPHTHTHTHWQNFLCIFFYFYANSLRWVVCRSQFLFGVKIKILGDNFRRKVCVCVCVGGSWWPHWFPRLWVENVIWQAWLLCPQPPPHS